MNKYFNPREFDINTAKIKIIDKNNDIISVKNDIFRMINKYGFVILELKVSEDMKRDLLSLSMIFGTVKKHNRSDETGISLITPLEGYPEYLATTNLEHPIHTDGPFEKDPPKIVALQCEIASMTGGLSKILSANAIFEYLVRNEPAGLRALFDSEAFTCARDNQIYTTSIFKVVENRIQMVYRYDQIVRVSIKPEAEDAFKLIIQYVNSTDNQLVFRLQPGQILITDNTVILHGRTSFPEGETRKFNRLWFYGDGDLSLSFGFTPVSVEGRSFIEKLFYKTGT